MAEMSKSVSLFIMGAITLLLAAVFISQAATQGNLVTDKTIVVNEVVNIASLKNATENIYNNTALTLANAPTGWKQTDCPLTDIVATNNSGTVLVDGTDYKLNKATGKVTFENTIPLNGTEGGSQNITLWDYTYCQDTYVTQSWGRTAIDTTMGLFAIAALLIGVALFYGAYKLWGIKD